MTPGPTFLLLTFVRQGSVLSPFLFALYLQSFQSDVLQSIYIVLLYAADILVMAPSVCEADQLLKSEERELIKLDMVINAKKSCCLRNGPRCNVACRLLSTSSGVEIHWKDKIRYLGAFVVQSRKFKRCLDDAKSPSIVPLTLFQAVVKLWGTRGNGVPLPFFGGGTPFP